ncbi:sensor histidine kinase [Streptomyces sp. DSM 44917]|uniref:histidine kinase n=1 Tax=Streptomyces boetiae TaxID=3075541 RepID=A0ABU2L223_9ACTN|nr:sensor histidine kinase [Streptomyces sp. DSM 44917]MDT0305565.1 sensor histidine kinase [Streptomyces sp. DSM 44917]
MFRAITQEFRADRTFLLTGAVLLADSSVLLFEPETGGWPALVLGRGLVVAGWLALGLRHRWPVAVAALVLVTSMVFFPLSSVDGVTPMLAFVIALYAVTRAGHLAAAVGLVAGIVLVIVTGEFVLHEEDAPRQVDNMAIALITGWLLNVVAFGQAMRVREAYLREAEQRALAAARQSATEERLRLARELHDVLGHNVSLITVQASAALHRSAKRPGQTEELVTALEFVRDAGKEALRELRATLGVLRQVDEEAPTAPAPAGLERLAELADRAAATGLRVRVETTGEPPVVPPQISLAAYRIVQESLTNVTRHAQARSATIRVAYRPGELRVDIHDDGRGAPPGHAPGSGITGMTERARALGGDLTATPTPDGFHVSARLPLPLPVRA